MRFRYERHAATWMCALLLLMGVQHSFAADVARDRGAMLQRASCLQGTFIQLVDENKSWPRSRWEQLFGQFKELKLDKLIVQWSVIDGEAFYPSRNFKVAGEPVLDWILSLADSLNMEVMIGLTHQSNHWDMVGKAEQRPGYLTDELGRIAQAVDELAPLVAKHQSFRGWYISQEVDDLNWNDDTSSENLRSFLFQTTTLLKTLTPHAKVGVSAFASKETAPENLELFWSRILARVHNLDTIYFQDGIGVHKLDLVDLPAYYKAMRAATTAHNRELTPVIEIFTQTGGMPVNDGAFSAKAAPLERVLDQIAQAESYSLKHVTFSIPEYMSSMRDESAQQAYDDYINYMKVKNSRCADH